MYSRKRKYTLNRIAALYSKITRCIVMKCQNKVSSTFIVRDKSLIMEYQQHICMSKYLLHCNNELQELLNVWSHMMSVIFYVDFSITDKISFPIVIIIVCK